MPDPGGRPRATPSASATSSPCAQVSISRAVTSDEADIGGPYQGIRSPSGSSSTSCSRSARPCRQRSSSSAGGSRAPAWAPRRRGRLGGRLAQRAGELVRRADRQQRLVVGPGQVRDLVRDGPALGRRWRRPAGRARGRRRGRRARRSRRPDRPAGRAAAPHRWSRARAYGGADGALRGDPPPPHGPGLRPRPAGAGRGGRRVAAQRDPRARRAGFSQGWDFLVLREAGRPGAFWAATPRAGRAGRLAARACRPRPLLVVCLSDKDALPGPVRRAGQGLDRPRRGPLAGALLGRRHRDGRRC